MKTLNSSLRLTLSIFAVAFSASLTAFGQFHDVGVFNVKLSLPAQMVVVGQQADTISHITLDNTAIVNLALGRPMGTKLNAKTEVLAAAVTFESHSNAPLSQLVVYNPTLNGQAGVVAVVGTLTSLNWQNAYENTINAGFGFATGTFKATTLGTPAQNGFLTSAVQGSGSCSGPHLFKVGDAKAAPKATITISGQAKFVYTDSKGTHNFDGLFVNGAGSLSGKPIGGW